MINIANQIYNKFKNKVYLLQTQYCDDVILDELLNLYLSDNFIISNIDYRKSLHLDLPDVSNTNTQSPSGYSVTLLAGENIPYGRLVIKNIDRVYLFNPNDITHLNRIIGISNTTSNINEHVNIQIDGLIDNLIYDFTSGYSVFADVNGTLTTTTPSTTILQIVGNSITNKSMRIDFGSPIVTI